MEGELNSVRTTIKDIEKDIALKRFIMSLKVKKLMSSLMTERIGLELNLKMQI